jgi:hypothetical protein
MWRALLAGPAAVMMGSLIAGRACARGEGEFVRPAEHPKARDAAGPLHVEPDLPPFNDQPWGRLSGNGWSYLRRTSSRDDDVVADPTAPFSPSDVLRIVFTPDMGEDHEPSVHWIGLPATREVYAAWWIKLSANWTASPAGGGKMTFLHAAPNGQGQVYSGLFGASAPHHISVNTEWEPYGQHVWDPNVATTPVRYGEWYRIEWYVRWESAPGAGDGVMRWWVNGVRNGDHANVRFPTGSAGFQQFEFAPTLQKPPAQVQYMYVDHTYLSIR